MSRNPRAQDVARFVGARMRQRRIDLGLSQQGLAMLLGVTYQQIHKYETGASRLVSERLFALASALDVEIGYFFEGLAPGGSQPHPEQRVVLGLVREFPGDHLRQAQGSPAVARAHPFGDRTREQSPGYLTGRPGAQPPSFSSTAARRTDPPPLCFIESKE